MPRLVGSVTQGGADAFAIAEVQTALSGQTRQAYLVKQITLQLDSGPFTSNAGIQATQVALCRRVKAAIPTIDDIDVLKMWDFASQIATAVGQIVQPEGQRLWTWHVPSPDARKISDGAIMVVEDPLYLMIDSASTTLLMTARIAIEYEIAQVTEVERLNLIAASLLA